MEVRRLGDVFLRSRSPTLSFLKPHLSARSWPRYQCADVPFTTHSSQIYPCCSKKTFSSTSSTRITPTPVSESEYGAGTNSSRVGGGNPTNDLNDVLNELLKPGERSPSSQQPSPRYRTGAGLAQSQGNSGTDVLSAIRWNRERGGVEVSKMINPKPAPSAQASASEAVHATAAASDVPQPTLRLGPSVGRSVAVEPERGIDLGRAFRNLDINCARNTVKGDFMRQRFHERPGLKRKRLRSTRWRRRFKEGFRAMVGKVEEMRRSGW